MANESVKAWDIVSVIGNRVIGIAEGNTLAEAIAHKDSLVARGEPFTDVDGSRKALTNLVILRVDPRS